MTQVPIVLTAGILPVARTGQRIPVKMLRILTRTAQSKLFAKISTIKPFPLWGRLDSRLIS